MDTFTALNTSKDIIDALKENGITKPTTIQQKAIPLINSGKDVIGISRTGSGKTASFGIPILQMVEIGKGVQSLILTPTRELANQISNELKKWSKYRKLTIGAIFGGVGYEAQEHIMQCAEIIVATPGRLLDHLQRGNLNLSKLKIFVLDEADKMVEMGFIEDIEKIISTTPENRQIILFGATISSEIDYLKEKYMEEPVIAEAELHVKKDLLEQYYYNVRHNEKFSLLIHLLKKEESDRIIIFCSKRSTVEVLNKNLHLQGFRSEMIHGKMRQNKRLSVMERFNKDKTNILVASSVAARGLDIKNVTHVYNYDLSDDPQEYVHRVGRTARAGESGKAITLLSQQDYKTFQAIFDIYKIGAEELPEESFPRLPFKTEPRQRSDRRYSPHHHSKDQANSRGQRNYNKSY